MHSEEISEVVQMIHLALGTGQTSDSIEKIKKLTIDLLVLTGQKKQD